MLKWCSTYKGLFTLNAKIWHANTFESKRWSLWSYSHQAWSFAGQKSKDLFSSCVDFIYLYIFPHRSATKQTIQLDLTVDHVPGAAAVAQNAESGGAVSKTSVNNHQKRVSRKREVYCIYTSILFIEKQMMYNLYTIYMHEKMTWFALLFHITPSVKCP